MDANILTLPQSVLSPAIAQMPMVYSRQYNPAGSNQIKHEQVLKYNQTIPFLLLLCSMTKSK